jgi:hypothetical protein
MLPVAALALFCTCGVLKKTGQQKSTTAKVEQPAAKADTSKKTANKLKPYKEVVTDKAVTDTGLFMIHKIDDRYLFEIGDSLLGRDILIVNRIDKSAAILRPAQGYLGYAGDQIGESVVQFEKGPNNKLFLKEISYLERSTDSSENGMYRSVLNSNIQPIVAAFDIKAYSPDSSGIVIDLTDFLGNDNNVLFFAEGFKNFIGLGAIQTDRSYIDGVKSFPLNVEIRTVKTYAISGANAIDANNRPMFPGSFATYELNSSIVLLPSNPMPTRQYDPRVGYFATGYRDFDANPQRVQTVNMITRWRLEPKPEDIERYKRGELVEPQKPIVFYIDPATPKKWVPYLIQGVNDWQKAFEKAGFKNAIIAKEAPTNDPEWSLYDARHNAIVYKPSVVPNASGPHVHDPRTGEILETHINWYHNVMQLLHDWYMIQAGAIDPKARKMQFDDSLMGQLIRFVSSHEVGHTLGLRHNFGSSSTVPVDSLRSKRWVEANGHTPSIMDYARFNYVAQPEDNISEKGIFPRIGVYDEWAIEWGYRWFPRFKNKDEEKTYMNQWVIRKLNADKRLWFGSEGVFYPDPRRQSEDLGDDVIKASTYGIKNLKRIVAQLPSWTREPNADYNNLRRMYGALESQYLRYIYHVVSYVGGVMETPKTVDQEGSEVEYVSRAKQKQAIRFLIDEALKEPYWLIDYPYVLSIGWGGTLALNNRREEILDNLTSSFTFLRLMKWEGLRPNEAYTVKELLTDLKEGIFSELKTGKNISRGQRFIQKAYIKRLIELLQPEAPKGADLIEMVLAQGNYINDVSTVAKGLLRTLEKEASQSLLQKHDELTRLHLEDIRDRAREALEIKK